MLSVRRTRRSSSVRKNQKLERDDRISNLPNDIKQQIPSYLPIKEAGKTSILSRNWRFQWAMLPSLVVSERCNLDLLLLLHHAPIDSFKLSAKHHRGAIDRCILHLSRNPIKKFILNFVRRRDSYYVPSYLFSCQDLTHLELSDCDLRLPAWTSQGFRNLKTLDIQRTILLPQELAKLIASSPLLESLTLCHMKVRISGFKIDAPNLRFLKLLGDFEAVELTSTLNLIHVSTDRSRGMWDIILRSTHALQELEISLVCQETEEASSWEFSKLQRLKVTDFYGDMSDVEFIKHLLLRSPALQELEVSVHQFCRQLNYSWLSHCNQNGTYSTTQLRLVKVTGICGAQVEVEFIKFLLSSCHALEELHILFGEKEYEYVNEYERECKRDQNCVLTQLRVMKIGGFSGAKAEVGLIRFLLTSSPMLQQITLQPASAKVSWEVSKLLNEFKGNSVQVNLNLLDPLNPSDDYYYSRAARSRSPDYRRRSRSPDYRRRSRSPSTDYDSDY